jgi:hypothetical protein
LSIQLTQTVRQMLAGHPQPIRTINGALPACLEAAAICAQSCTSCADACLAEPHVGDLIQCIRLTQDCAAICTTTAALLSRQTATSWKVMRLQVEACRVACDECGRECDRHAKMHDHCRICAMACRLCEQACADLLVAMPS